MDRGSLVWTIHENDERRLARVVVGPHYQGEFEVVVLCEPQDWVEVEADCRPADDYWGEACFTWPVESIEKASPDDLP